MFLIGRGFGRRIDIYMHISVARLCIGNATNRSQAFYQQTNVKSTLILLLVPHTAVFFGGMMWGWAWWRGLLWIWGEHNDRLSKGRTLDG
jgi:hypothetical protein